MLHPRTAPPRAHGATATPSWTAARALALLLAACTGPGPDKSDTDPVDSEPTESEPPDSEPLDSEPDDSEPNDSEPNDTDPVAPDPICSANATTGTCPTGLTCLGGACVHDLGATGPAPTDPLTTWHEAIDWFEALDLHADRHPLTWQQVRDEVAAELPNARTEAEAGWWMSRGVARMLDGHTSLSPAALCALDPGYAARESDTGACVIEVGGELLVTATSPATPWQLGDALLELDGRTPDLLINDRLAQPRCRNEASTNPSLRALAVASLMMRDRRVSEATVRRADGTIERFPVPAVGARLACTGRVPDPNERDAGGDVRVREVGGVTVLHLPAMGTNDGGFSDTPMIEAARAELASLDPSAPLVIDLRGNRGGFGSVPDAVASWLLPPGTVLRRCTDRTGPQPASLSGYVEARTTEDGLAWTGPVALVLDALTYGAGTYLDLALRERAVRVGQPSSASYGIQWTGPGTPAGAATDGRRCVDEDDLPLEGTSDIDLAVLPTQQGLAEGRDEVLEAAVAELLGP